MKRGLGFTLVEVLVVVAIVGILTAIAVPQYSQYVMRGKVTEATGALSELRLRAEKWFADNRTYVGVSATIGNATNFSYACVTAAATFTCTATGTGSMTGFVFTINETNTRATTITGHTGWNNSTTCWITKKGMTC